MDGQSRRRWYAILQELIANKLLTDRERRRIADAVDSTAHAGVLRQLALDTAAACGRRSTPGSTPPFPQPDLADAFSKAAQRPERSRADAASPSIHSMEGGERAHQPANQIYHADARRAELPCDRIRAEALAHPAARPRPSRPC